MGMLSAKMTATVGDYCAAAAAADVTTGHDYDAAATVAA